MDSIKRNKFGSIFSAMILFNWMGKQSHALEQKLFQESIRKKVISKNGKSEKADSKKLFKRRKQQVQSLLNHLTEQTKVHNKKEHWTEETKELLINKTEMLQARDKISKKDNNLAIDRKDNSLLKIKIQWIAIQAWKVKIVIQFLQIIIKTNIIKTRISHKREREEHSSMFPTVTLKWPVKMSQNQSKTLKSQLIRLAKTCLTHSMAVQTSLLMTLKLQQTLSKTPPTKMIQRAVNQIMIRTNSKSHQLTANKMIKTMLQTMWVIWQAQIIKEIQLLPMMKRSTTKPMQT